MEIFYEQNVANPNIDKHKKRTVVLSVLRIVLLAIGIIAGLFLLGFGVQIGKGALTTVIQLGMVVLSVAPFVLTYILLGRFLRNSNTEYDYILNGDVLRIVSVVRRTKRKLSATVRIASVESIGRITGEAYDRYAASKDIKKKFALCNYDNEEKIVYIRYRSEGENFLLHIEPDDEMIASLRKSLPRMGIMDKSMGLAVK
ncbi:MAG: hypothetical protein HFE47_01130 [Clostridia bacterium]|jgi:hypothetical protein|nr:hypothetical protein [Clostridia bacterium]